jgi:N-acetylneuraminate synthase
MTYVPQSEIQIGHRPVGLRHPTYFIADIAANHDGDLGRARDLIHLASEAGADAAKFQHFSAPTIVSDYGFRSLGGQKSHQAAWEKSVYEVYADASIDPDWTPKLVDACEDAGISFFTSPYSMELVDEVEPYVQAYKIGSGDITWPEIIRHMARKGKPVLLATGASEMSDVQMAVAAILAETPQMVLMQCNTNYTASLENFRYLQLNVLKSYAVMYPGAILGLSDHTPGHAAVLGAVSLGARVIEKHFTDDRSRIGPDHAFSMDPTSWRDMVQRTRELERALGSGLKRVEENERETVVLQRRCVRAAEDLKAGTVLRRENVSLLRPAPRDGIFPYESAKIIGMRLRVDVPAGAHLRWMMLDDTEQG